MVRAAAGGVADGLGHGEVGGGLDRGRVPPVLGPEDLDRQRRGVGEGGQRGAYPGLGQHRGIDPVGEVPQFLQNVSRLAGRPGQGRLGRGVTVRLRGGAGEPDVVGQGQQPLLGAVVQVPLQPAAFGIGGLHDAGPGGAKLLELGEQLGLQPFVLQAEPDGRPDLALDPGHRPGVRDGGDGALVPGQAGHCAAAGCGGFGDQPAAGVDVALPAGEPVGDLQPRIVQRRRERGLQGTRRGRLVQAGRDPGDRAALGPGPGHPGDQTDGQQRDRGTPDSEDGEQGRVERVLDRDPLQRHRTCRHRRGEPDRGDVDRQQPLPRRPRCPRQPRRADNDEGERGSGGEPAVANLHGAGQRRQRADEEGVDRAIRQAARVEVGVPE